MTDLYNFFRGVILLAFMGVLVWGIAQLIPQAQSAATLPARIQSDNARILQEAQAAPTFVALSVTATAAAIQNESLRAQAESSAMTIAAQGTADAQRANANAIQSAVWGVVGVLAFSVAVVALLVVVRGAFASSAHSVAIREASRAGGRLELPNGHAVSFEPRVAPKQINASHSSDKTIQGKAQSVGKRR